MFSCEIDGVQPGVSMCGVSPSDSWDCYKTSQRDRPRHIGVLMGFAELDEVWQTYLQVFRQVHPTLAGRKGKMSTSNSVCRRKCQRARLAAATLLFERPIRRCLRFFARPARFRLCSHGYPNSVGSGYASSLARPGGNVTGFHNLSPRLEKWLGILKQIAPQVRCVGAASCSRDRRQCDVYPRSGCGF